MMKKQVIVAVGMMFMGGTVVPMAPVAKVYSLQGANGEKVSDIAMADTPDVAGVIVCKKGDGKHEVSILGKKDSAVILNDNIIEYKNSDWIGDIKMKDDGIGDIKKEKINLSETRLKLIALAYHLHIGAKCRSVYLCRVPKEEIGIFWTGSIKNYFDKQSSPTSPHGKSKSELPFTNKPQKVE